MKALNNKVVLITGLSRGIGREIAERFAMLGADIVINYTNNKAAADEVENAIKEFNVKVISV